MLGAAALHRSNAQAPDLVSRLATAPAAQRGAITRDLWASVAGHAPLRQPMLDSRDSVAITFLFDGDSGSTRSVALQGGPARLVDSMKTRLSRIAGTNVWRATFVVPTQARFLYTFGVVSAGDTTRRVVRDTFNVRTAAQAPGLTSSLFEGLAARSLELSLVRPGVPTGSLTPSTYESKTLGQTRRIWTYLPPRFATSQRLPLLVVFDGAPYTNAGYVPTQTILDNLIAAQRIRPVVVVFIDTPQPSRQVDLWLSAPFADFVTDELIPWARRIYGLSTDATETAAAGSSLGGLTAMFIALRKPTIVARVISQSGSYWTGMRAGSDADKAPEWMARAVASKPHLPIDIWMEVGAYESAGSNEIGMMPTNRRLRDLLRSKGYSVDYSEFAGGHEYINWRASLGDALVHVFASDSGTRRH